MSYDPCPECGEMTRAPGELCRACERKAIERKVLYGDPAAKKPRGVIHGTSSVKAAMLGAGITRPQTIKVRKPRPPAMIPGTTKIAKRSTRKRKSR